MNFGQLYLLLQVKTLRLCKNVIYFSDIPSNILKYFSMSHSKKSSFFVTLNEFSPVTTQQYFFLELFKTVWVFIQTREFINPFRLTPRVTQSMVYKAAGLPVCLCCLWSHFQALPSCRTSPYFASDCILDQFYCMFWHLYSS